MSAAEVQSEASKSEAPLATQDAANADAGTSTTASDDESKAADQIAFYFSDVNLPFDRFLFTTSQASLPSTQQLSQPGTGWVSLTTILAFKRMQKYQQGLGLERVANALRKHKSQFLKVSEDNQKVARQSPIVPPQSEDVLARSVYIKGFPKEQDWSDKPNTLQEAIEEWCKQYGEVNVVRMRREGGNDPKAKGKPFKGSIFVEFTDKESPKKILEQDPKPTFPGMGEPIETMMKLAYIDMKAKEKGIPTSGDFKDQQKGPRKFNAFKDLKFEAKNKKKEENAKREYKITYEGKELEVNNEGKLKDPSAVEFRRSLVLRVTNVDTDNFNFRNLKKILAEIHAPTFVKKEDGDSFGLVGFREPVTDEVFKKIENMDFSQVSETGEGGAKWERLNEQEEREYHLQRAEFFAKQEKEGGSKPRGGPGGRGGRGGGRGGRGGGRGGRGGGQKRSRDDGDAVDQPDNKKSKKE